MSMSLLTLNIVQYHQGVRAAVMGHAKEVQAQIQVEYVIEHTGSVSEDEFIDRFYFITNDQLLKGC